MLIINPHSLVKRALHWQALLIYTALTIITLIWWYIFQSEEPHPGSLHYAAANRTLGFERILVLNTKTRTDRRRTMDALAEFHGLQFDFIRTYTRMEADRLSHSNGYLINGTHLACYLSHLDAYRWIIKNGISSALILEDDVDMEVDMRARHASVMAQLGARYNYLDWDMLYLGRCTSDTNEPTDLRPKTGDRADFEEEMEEKRRYAMRPVALYPSEYPMCLHAYAVTRECAKRLVVLLEERLKTVGEDIDLVLAVGVKYGVSTVLGVSPPYVVQVGRRDLPSDLTLLRDGDTAQFLVNSTLYYLHLRSTDPRTIAPYIDWGWFTFSV